MLAAAPIRTTDRTRPITRMVGCSLAAPATASTLSSDIDTSATTICQIAAPKVVAPDEALADTGTAEAAVGAAVATTTFGAAVWQIVVADVSMSLDNVLAVAGAAKDHPTILVIGLLLSVVLMGAAANMIAHVLHKHRWIGWIGLAIITYVALDMIWRGGNEVLVQAHLL